MGGSPGCGAPSLPGRLGAGWLFGDNVGIGTGRWSRSCAFFPPLSAKEGRFLVAGGGSPPWPVHPRVCSEPVGPQSNPGSRRQLVRTACPHLQETAPRPRQPAGPEEKGHLFQVQSRSNSRPQPGATAATLGVFGFHSGPRGPHAPLMCSLALLIVLRRVKRCTHLKSGASDQGDSP